MMSKINKLGEYKGIAVNVVKQCASDEEVNKQIQNFMKSKSATVEKTGKVANGDITTIDFEGFKDGVAFDGGKAAGFKLEIGSHSFIPGFEEQMVGMEKGETRDLKLTFPQDYQAPELAGADVVFSVTVHNIEEKKPATLDDEFVKSLNITDVSNVEEFQTMMKEYVENQFAQNYYAELEKNIFNEVIANSDVEVDEDSIKRATFLYVQNLKSQLAQQGLEFEQYLQMMGTDMEAFFEQLRPSAIQQASFEAIIDEIAQLENIEMSDDEVTEQMERIAEANNVTLDMVKEKIGFDNLKRDLLRMKASKFVIDNANVTNN